MSQCQLCKACEPFGRCVNREVPLVTNKELNNPEFIRDVREYMADLPVSSWGMLDYMLDGYRDFQGWVYHPLTNAHLFLDIDELIECDHREWFRDLCRPIPPEAKPFLRPATRDRFRVVATILRLMDRKGTARWGLRAANDNKPDA